VWVADVYPDVPRRAEPVEHLELPLILLRLAHTAAVGAPPRHALCLRMSVTTTNAIVAVIIATAITVAVAVHRQLTLLDALPLGTEVIFL
jgi:hypothetical protein